MVSGAAAADRAEEHGRRQKSCRAETLLLYRAAESAKRGKRKHQERQCKQWPGSEVIARLQKARVHGVRNIGRAGGLENHCRGKRRRGERRQFSATRKHDVPRIDTVHGTEPNIDCRALPKNAGHAQTVRSGQNKVAC